MVSARGVPKVSPWMLQPPRPVTDPQQGENCSARLQILQLQNLSRFGSQAVKHPNSSQLVKGL